MINRGDIQGRLDASFNGAFKSSMLKSVYPCHAISTLFKTYSGGTPNKSNYSYWNGNIPWVSPKDFKSFALENTEDYITEEAIKHSSTSVAPENSLLMVVRSGVLVHTIPVALTKKTMAFNQDVKAFVPTGSLLPAFLAIYFKIYNNEVLPLIVKHSTTVQSINTAELNSLKVPVPPIEVQNVAIEMYQSAISTKKQKETEAAELLASIDGYLLDALGITLPPPSDKKTYFMCNSKQVSGRRFDSFYHQDEFEKLEQALLGGKYGIEKLGTLLAQINYGASVKNEYADTGIPFLRISDLNRNEINVKEMKFLPENMHKYLGNAFVYENDFLISRSGTLGVVALATKEINGFAYGSFMIKFCLKQDAPVNKKFISYFLNSETMQKIVGKNKIGAIQGNITIPTIKNLQIPLPPLETQTEIADQISAIRAKAKQLQHEAQAELEQAKKTIEKMILG